MCLFYSLQNITWISKEPTLAHTCDYFEPFAVDAVFHMLHKKLKSSTRNIKCVQQCIYKNLPCV